MNVVMIVPTGLGAAIGGHAGDATPAARLLATTCENLILHPNVVNASDINEMPANALYVEGSMLNRFLQGHIKLRKVRANRICVVTNKPVRPEIVNAVSAARATLGVEAFIIGLNTPLKMKGWVEKDKAVGEVAGWEELVEQLALQTGKFDALAVSSPIEVNEEVELKYLRHGGVNPWGGVEAIVSKLIGEALNKPVAHAPCGHLAESKKVRNYNKVVDPRMAAEMVSVAYIHCVLKGLHKAPQPSKEGLSVDDIDCLVSPLGCVGPPHSACLDAGIPIIIVRENTTGHMHMLNVLRVENYFEAAGLILAMREGIALNSLRRPLQPTEVL